MSDNVYWLSPLGGFDDFDSPYDFTVGAVMYDAKTVYGPWANMTQESFEKHAIGYLGTGYGQKYQMQDDGKWLKVGG